MESTAPIFTVLQKGWYKIIVFLNVSKSLIWTFSDTFADFYVFSQVRNLKLTEEDMPVV